MTALLKLFDIVPGFVWAIVCAGALLVAGVERTRGASARQALAELKLAAETARADAERRQREKEAQYARDVQEVATNAQAQLNALAGDLAASRAAADGLRAAATSAARRACPASGVAGTGQGQPGADPLGVFVDVLGGLEERGRAVSEYADRLRVAGEACERYADAVER